MSASLEETIISVWRQVLIENSQAVVVGGRRFPVLQTSRSKLCEIDFEFNGETYRGLEQNPDTKSLGAARAGREEGYAIPEWWAIYRQRSRRKSSHLLSLATQIFKLEREDLHDVRRDGCVALNRYTRMLG
jgi:hypothetical protein